MNSTKRPYESPSLRLDGAVSALTRTKTTGTAEAISPMLPRDSAGDLGFGL